MDLKRGLSPELKGVIANSFFHPIIFVWLDWPDGPVRAHSGSGTITWDGHIWYGVGAFGAIDVPEESLSGVPIEWSASLVCDLPELAGYANSSVRGRHGRVWLGVTTLGGGSILIGEPVQMVAGTMDALVLRLEASGIDQLYQLTVTCATGPGYRSAAAIHHSHEDQSRKYPGDTAGQQLMQIMAKAQKTQWPAP